MIYLSNTVGSIKQKHCEQYHRFSEEYNGFTLSKQKHGFTEH